MKKCLWYAAAILAAVTAAEAKRDFYVEKEVRCGAGEMCYEKESGMLLNGTLHRYYDNGVVQEDMSYANGVKNGVTRQYYPDGKQQAYLVYQNGLLEGRASVYYDNGYVKYETDYTAGVMNGKRTAYDEDGKLKSEIVYEMGEPVSAVCRKENGQRVDFSGKVKIYLFMGMTPCGAY